MTTDDTRIASHAYRATAAFTLLEITIVLGLIAVILAGSLVLLTSSVKKTQRDVTIAKMKVIDTALYNYAVSHNRLPCPSDNTVAAPSNSAYNDYGREAANPGTCTGGTPAANDAFSGSSAVEGGLPTRALSLDDSYMYDGWGHRFNYAVNPYFTGTNVLPIPVAGLCLPSTQAMKIEASASGPTVSSNAAYALISHGANGQGARTAAGVVVNSGSQSQTKLINCHCNSNGTDNTSYVGSTQAIYVQTIPGYESSHAGSDTYYYDDLVTYKEPVQLQDPAALPNLTQTFVWIPIFYAGESLLQEFCVSTGSFYQTYPSSPGNGPFQLPISITTDTTGNVYVFAANDFVHGTHTFQEMSPTGTMLTNQTISSVYWYGMAVDSQGNLIAGGSNGNIYVYSMAGNSPTLTKTLSGFSNIQGLAIDANGNYWVSDNNQVKKVSPNGTVLLTLGSTTLSSTLGLFSGPKGVAIDLSGNVWVADNENNRLEQFSPDGIYLGWIGSGSSYGNVTISAPTGLTIDRGDNLWVTEGTNAIELTYSSTNQTWSKTNSLLTYGTGNGQAIITPYGIAMSPR